MLTIHLYLDNEEETEITSLYQMQSDPFLYNFESKEPINISINDLVPRDISKYDSSPKVKHILLENQKTKQRLFHLKSILPVKRETYLNTNATGDTTIEIEYHCEVI